MKEEKWYLVLDRYQHGVLINALNLYRNKCLQEGKPVDYVNETFLKVVKAPTRKGRRGNER